MKLLDLYKSILECGGLTSDDEGFVSVKFDKKSSPALIHGKRLVLPTQKQLSAENWNDKIIFHPLSENILRGESEVITKMRSVFNIRLNYTFAALAQNLLTIITSIGEHHKLTPEQSEILTAVKNVDETTLISFTKMMVNSIQESPEKVFINIFLKRGGTINGKKHSRVGVVTFPLYEELKKEQEVYYGVKLRSKDRLGLLQLYEYMLPNLDTPEAYNFGSDSGVAPFLDALMGSVLGIASKMNDILELFKGLIDAGEDLVFESNWVESFENLNEMIPQIRLIPSQAGNEGKTKVMETPVHVAAPAPVHLQTFQPPPAVAPYQPQPVYNPQQPPQQFQQPQVAGPIITENGLDFNSLLRSNPQLAARVAPFNAPQMMQPGLPQNQAPRWASPQMQPGYGQPMYPQPMYQQPGYPQAPMYQQPGYIGGMV